VVAGPVDEPRLDDHDRRAGGGTLLGQLVREVLGLVVVRDEAVAFVASIALVDRLSVGVAKRVHGRDVDDPVDPRVRRRVEHALSATHVRVVHRLALRLRHPDAVVRGDVEGCLAALHAATNGVGVSEVALNHLGVEPRSLLRRAREHHHVVTAVAQPLDDARADEPRSTGHESSHGAGSYP
jgi:hypothetical protein